MSAFKSFEDIKAWQEARTLCKLINNYISKESFSKDYKLKDQINGSSGSVMDNIAEGFERGGNNEFINFLRYSKGSCGETRSQLYRALDRNYVSIEEFETALKITESVSSKTQKFISYLLQSDMRGPNYKPKK